MKVSPYMLQKVEITLQLQTEVCPNWDISFPLAGPPLAPSEYNSYFCQVCSALPELDQNVIMRVAVCYSSHLFANLISVTHYGLAKLGYARFEGIPLWGMINNLGQAQWFWRRLRSAGVCHSQSLVFIHSYEQ
jgi:hypothetical protein